MGELSRSRDEDRENRDKYFESQAKYQLQVHSDTNPGLYLSPEKRSRRNMRAANFDKGLKEDRHIDRFDPQYKASYEMKVLDQRMKIFPKTRRRAIYSGECDLDQCQERFEEKETSIVGVMLYKRKKNMFEMKKATGKYYWICASHSEEATSSDEEIDTELLADEGEDEGSSDAS